MNFDFANVYGDYGILFKLGMCAIITSIKEQCSLLLPLLWGAGPMALMLWLDGMMMMMSQHNLLNGTTPCPPAGWLAKCGSLAETLELQLLPKGADWKCNTLSASQRSATKLAVAAALEKAAAAAGSNSGFGGLRIQSCKLEAAGAECAAILQALPASTLTNLDLDLYFWKGTDAASICATMDRLAAVLPSLQQLQQLKLQYFTHHQHNIYFDRVLSGFGALTNLTQLDLLEVRCRFC
jgi:hypothetical protein